jgi:hypothetical protein
MLYLNYGEKRLGKKINENYTTVACHYLGFANHHGSIINPRASLGWLTRRWF